MPASVMTYAVLGVALNFTHSLTTAGHRLMSK